MNLTKNVSGTWEQMKNYLRADLDTIQRQVNQILGQINAPVVPDKVPPPILSAANTATVFGKNFLTSVSLAPNSGLSGSGTVLDPLQATSAGAQLLLRTLSSAECRTLNSVPIEILPAVPSTTYVAVALYKWSHQPAALFATTQANLFYGLTAGGGGGPDPGCPSLVGLMTQFQTNAIGDNFRIYMGFSGGAAGTGSIPNTPSNKSIYIQTNADGIAGFDPTGLNSVLLALLYLKVPA